MNTNYEFTASYTENPFWYQQFDFSQIAKLRGAQPIVDFDAAGKFRLCVMTMKVMTIHYDIPSIPIDNFKDHLVLVFDFTSMQDVSKNCHYPELVGGPLMLEPNFTYHLEHVTEFIVLEERLSSVAGDKIVIVGNNI